VHEEWVTQVDIAGGTGGERNRSVQVARRRALKAAIDVPSGIAWIRGAGESDNEEPEVRPALPGLARHDGSRRRAGSLHDVLSVQLG
jgi:hypothetical protein